MSFVILASQFRILQHSEFITGETIVALDELPRQSCCVENSQLGKAKAGDIPMGCYFGYMPGLVDGSVAFDIPSSAVDEMNHRVSRPHLVNPMPFTIVFDRTMVDVAISNRLETLIPVDVSTSRLARYI